MTIEHSALLVAVGFCYSLLMGTVKSPGKEFAISWRVKGFSEFKATESPFGHLVKAHSFVSLGQDLKHYLLNKIPDVVKQKNQGALLRLKMNT